MSGKWNSILRNVKFQKHDNALQDRNGIMKWGVIQI